MIQWSARILGDRDLSAELNMSAKFVVQGRGGGVWFFDCRGTPQVSTEDKEADCTVTIGAETLVRMAAGELNPQVAYLQGKIRVGGDRIAALRLSLLMSSAAALRG